MGEIQHQLAIAGEWFVLGTTFPMWKKGDKRNPRFRYTALDTNVWKDEVLYENKTGKTKLIKGKDRVLSTNPPRFKWRGDGLLAIAVSNWQVDHISSDEKTMLISFRKTLFTPAGIDVISREKELTDDEKKKWQAIINQKFEGKMDADWVWLY